MSRSDRIVIAGSSGFVGSPLLPELETRGFQVVPLARTEQPRAGRVSWDPAAGRLDPSALEGARAVVNLSGAGIAERRWTDSYKQTLRKSRLDSTTTLVEAMAQCEAPPSVLVNASAIGFYGDRGDEVLDEASPRGAGFLADLAADWEEAALAAQSLGVRTVLLRFGVILGAGGGALQRMLLPFKLGLGGRLGSGRQWWSWVSLDDVVGAAVFAVETDSLQGPVNVTAPEPIRNQDFTRVLARHLHRPALFPAPAPALRALLGPMADELLLSSTRALPKALQQAGFAFRHSDLAEALSIL